MVDEPVPADAPASTERSPGAKGGGLQGQYELANERTYLAWLRTGLALVAAGVAADRLLPVVGMPWVRQTIGITLVLAGAVTAALARRRWELLDRAFREGRPLPRPYLGYLVAVAIVVDGLAAMFLMIRADTYRP